MLTYFLCILIVLTISFFSVDKRAKKEYHLFFSIILIFTLTIIAGTRLVGYDFDVYATHFKAVPDLLHYKRTDVSLEIGYELLVNTPPYRYSALACFSRMPFSFRLWGK